MKKTPLLLFFLFFFLSTSAQQTTVSISKEELLGLFSPEQHPQFVKLSSAYASGNNVFLRKETASAFMKMADAARKDGIYLKVVSGTRNFEYQKKIWDRKYNQLKGSPSQRAREILSFSSMPGTSRHHWGTDIDINTVEPEYFHSKEGKNVYAWLQKNGPKYGFYQTYQGGEKSGYQEEKWHWTYQPLSGIFLKAYNAYITYEDIKGFKGSETAKELQVIEVFVNGINPEILWVY